MISLPNGGHQFTFARVMQEPVGQQTELAAAHALCVGAGASCEPLVPDTSLDEDAIAQWLFLKIKTSKETFQTFQLPAWQLEGFDHDASPIP